MQAILHFDDGVCCRGLRPLAASPAPIAEAEARDEERRRLRQFETEAARAADPEKRLLALDVNAIEALIPTWRAWGKIIRQAG